MFDDPKYRYHQRNNNDKNLIFILNSFDIYKSLLYYKVYYIMNTIHNVVIIGGGCAGLSAGIYCARAGLNPLLFVNNLNEKGGLLVKTSIVENYPGYPDGIMGFDLVQNMEQQATNSGATIIDREIVAVDFSKKPFVIVDDEHTMYYTNSIIISTGSKPNKLLLPNEENLWAHGISSCAVCDGALYRNKKIVVVGGGDSAMEEAQFLTKFSDVILIHRRDTFRASKVMQKKVFNNPKIKIIYNAYVTKLLGDTKLTGIIIKYTDNLLETEIPVDGLFYGLGLKPNTKLFQDKLDMDSEGYIIKNHDFKYNHEYETMTSCKGIFVAGDCNDKIYRQAIVAAGDGCKAALDVNNYLTMENS